jgi:outer membrane protein assembly factor BamB
MRRSNALQLLIAVLLLTIATGCPPPDRPDREPNPGGKRPGTRRPAQPQDGRVVEGGGDWKDNHEVLSPLILRAPLYECTKVVWVSGFIPGAEVLLFEGPNPIGGGMGQFSPGQQFNVTISFVKGQVITARQKFNGVTGGPSNAVTVRRASEDYPSGIPKPAIVPPPLFNCGLAIGATDFVAGAEVAARSEAALGAGGFGPITTIGSSPMASPYPGGWMTISPAYTLGARVTLQFKICADKSPASNPQIVQAQPAITPPTIDNTVYEGGRIVVVHNILNGALLTVKSGATQIGQSPTPGGSGQQLWITPAATSGATLTATQKLCDESGPSPGVTVHPCGELPAAIIKQPQPGDDRVEVITFIPGARIIILAGGVEIGDGGPPIVPLTRPLNNGEELTVIQMIGECRSRFVHVIIVRCPFGDNPLNCSADWPMFRQNASRTALQSKPSVLTTPDLVRLLKVKPGWPFRPSGAAGFRASPVVFNGKVYIGNGNGRFFAINATTGAEVWHYPPTGQPPLTSRFTCNPSSFGIAASATIAHIRDKQGRDVDAVIFGAPDQSIGRHFGSGRLFALDAATGAEIWKSGEVAVLNGDTPGDDGQLHEQIGYSSPVVVGNRVYVGIANHCDNPIQNGKVVAVDLSNGNIDPAFNYRSTNTRGGGVWSSVAAGGGGELYITTGNSASGNAGGEPSVNNALSMLRLNPTTGAVIWKLQPVPFSMDGDPDWASGPTYIPSACGPLVASTMKDGWTYAVAAGGSAPAAPAVRWQHPATGFPFTPGDHTSHGDTRYVRPGAAWNNVFITMTGGENVTASVTSGYTRLHGFNLCSGRTDLVRWLLDVPNTAPGGDDRYRLGPPTVTGGIYFVTTSEGHLVVFADPAVWPAAGSRCSNPAVSNGDCVANGFKLVPQPSVLANIAFDGSMILTEPALAGGRVYIATGGGNLYMLEP